MAKELWGFVVCIVLLSGCDLATVQSPEFYNLDFEETVRDTVIPYIWEYENRGGYTIQLIDSRKKGGKSLRIHCEKPNTEHFRGIDSLVSNQFYLRLPADLVKGKNLKISAKVKTKAVTKGAYLIIGIMRNESILQHLNDPASGQRGTKEWKRISIETKVDENATDIFIGGAMAGRGTAWFDNFEIHIDGKRLQDASPPSVPTAEEIEWLRPYIHPITSVDPAEPSDDLLPLIEKIKEVKVVALGSSTYGSSESVQMRHRIIKAIAEQGGKQLLFMNVPLSAAYMLDYYSRYKEENLDDMHWMVTNDFLDRTVFLEMMKDIRKLNEEGADITIAGYENLDFKTTIRIMERVLGSDAEVREELTSLQNLLVSYLRQKYANKDTTGLAEKEERIHSLLQSTTAYVDRHITEPELLAGLHHVLLTLEQFMEKAYLINEHRVNNVLWWQQLKPQAQSLIWSSNYNAKRTGYTMGSVQAEKLGDNYLSIGFAFYDGAYYAHNFQGAPLIQNALTAYPGTYEYYFHQLNEPCFMIDLREIRKDLSPEGEWLRKPALFRYVETHKTTTEFSRARLTSDYDILIFIDRSTGTKHARY